MCAVFDGSVSRALASKPESRETLFCIKFVSVPRSRDIFHSYHEELGAILVPKNWCAFQGLELINAHELASVEMQVVSAWWDLGMYFRFA